ncbi:MAG: hypothetical protein Q8P92_03050 [Candidatus Daviesbacteria bacterium]|nr:hypothetical protein [Candidatus Daviesbacteria bacterium]
MISFTDKQIEKLSDLFMDLAKGLFLAGFTLQIVREVDILALLKYIAGGIIFAYSSLRLLKKRS